MEMSRLGLVDFRRRHAESATQTEVEWEVPARAAAGGIRHLRPSEQVTIEGASPPRVTLVLSGAATLMTDGWHVDLVGLQGFRTCEGDRHVVKAGDHGAALLSLVP
jgi:hypothetical protein